MPAKRAAGLAKALAASLLLWSAFVVWGLKPTHLCLESSEADVPAHIDSAILFYYRGLGIYRGPVSALGARSHSPQAAEYAARYGWLGNGVADLIDIPERAGKPPFMINWSYIPRPYPPGVLLYFLPEALLKEGLGLSPLVPSRLALIKLLVAAHLFFWFFAGAVLSKDGADAWAQDLAVWIILPLVYIEAVGWSLHGFFDCAPLAALLLSVAALARKDGVKTVFWYAVSVFLHFRTLWFLPVLGAGAWLLAGGGKKLDARGVALLTLSAVLLALSAYVFILVYPWLNTLQPTNYFFLTAEPASWLRLLYLLVPLGLIAVPLWHNRSWLVLACLAWTIVMLVRSPFVQFWHSLYLTPLFAMTGLGERSAARTRLFVLVAYLVLASLAFTYFSFNGLLLMNVFKELWG